jgi:hypothetical protein
VAKEVSIGPIIWNYDSIFTDGIGKHARIFKKSNCNTVFGNKEKDHRRYGNNNNSKTRAVGLAPPLPY